MKQNPMRRSSTISRMIASEARWRGMDSVKDHANLEQELDAAPLNYAGAD